MLRRLGLLMILVCMVAFVTACEVDYSGQYGGRSDAGIFVSMTLEKDGTVETNILGFPLTGTYTVKKNQITVTITTMGYSQSVQGKISKDAIEFADVTLKRGAVEYSSNLPGGLSGTSAMTPDTQNSSANSNINSTASDIISFSDPTVLECICDQYGFDASEITQKDLLQVTTLDIDLVAESLYNLDSDLSLVDLKYLPNLEELRITSNYQLTVDLKGITYCKNLRILEFENCWLNDLERIGTLTHLEELSITSERGEGIVDYSPLENLASLKKLSLIWNGYNAYNPYYLTDASSISTLVNLEELTISNVGIKNYSLARLSNLTSLELTHYDTRTLFSELFESGAWRNLRHLACNIVLDTETLSSLCRLTNLEYLYLDIKRSDDVLTLDGIDNLIKLETLIITAVPFGFENMDAIGGITTLKELQIRYNADEVSLDYINNLRMLKYLYLQTDRDISLSEFSNLSNLEIIEIVTYSSWQPPYLDLNGVNEMVKLKEIRYYGYQIKSTMPLDDHPDILLKKK